MCTIDDQDLLFLIILSKYCSLISKLSSCTDPPFKLFFVFVFLSFEVVLRSFEVNWGLLGSPLLTILAFFYCFLTLFELILYGENIFISFRYLFIVEEDMFN